MKKFFRYLIFNEKIPVFAAFVFGIACWTVSKIAAEVFESKVVEYKINLSRDSIKIRISNLSHSIARNIDVQIQPVGNEVFLQGSYLTPPPDTKIYQSLLPDSGTCIVANIDAIPPDSHMDITIPYQGCNMADPIVTYLLTEDSGDVCFQSEDFYTRIAKNRFQLYIGIFLVSMGIFIITIIFRIYLNES